jgi:putative transposase
MEDAQRSIEVWRRDGNESRPRMALKDRTPAEFARELAARGQFIRVY